MKPFLRINLYEIQTILYWILGVLILSFGTLKFLGWLAIVYGWLNFLFCIFLTLKHREELEHCFEVKDYLDAQEIQSHNEQFEVK